MNATVVQGDLLDQPVEAIVNAWNRNVFQCARFPWEDVITGAGRLPFRAIIHVAGISLWWRASERSIRGSVQSAMAIVNRRGFASVAFPATGAGSGSFNASRAVTIMQDELSRLESQARVTIVEFRPREPR